MMYRPQFAYSTLPGCKDEDFVYFFDGSNTPFLNQSVSALSIPYIPLILDQDAPFYWRGIKIDMRTTGAVPPNVNVKLRDCYQNDLSDGLVPATQYGFPQNPVTFNGQNYTGAPVPLEPEIYCPRGGVILFFFEAPTLANPSYLSVTLFGVKRFTGCA
jgi:hypothetical protein